MTPLEMVLLRVCFGGHHALADVIYVLARAVHGDRLAITLSMAASGRELVVAIRAGQDLRRPQGVGIASIA